MKISSWVWKGVLYGIALWTVLYIGIPYFDETLPIAPENHWLELIFAIPAGIAWGYYRFVVIPRKMKKFDLNQKKEPSEEGS